MLAMIVNDNAGCLIAHVVWSTIASMLAPTGLRYTLTPRTPLAPVGAAVRRFDLPAMRSSHPTSLVPDTPPSRTCRIVAPSLLRWDQRLCLTVTVAVVPARSWPLPA